MIIFKNPAEVNQYCEQLRRKGLSIGFVPTMGALHQGHVSLIRSAKSQNDKVVCSIFINPTQFNNAEDLLMYPKTEALDIVDLETAGCDVCFLPNNEALYALELHFDFTFNGIDQIFEGASRPGHFNGVGRVVKLLLEVINPNFLYLGMKDYQQCLIISLLIKQMKLNCDVVIVKTKRLPNGVAMSSRNKRLNNEQIIEAALIYESLRYAKEQYTKLPLGKLKQDCIYLIESAGNMKVDYFVLAIADNLEEIDTTTEKKVIALAAVYLAGVRLLDNMFVN